MSDSSSSESDSSDDIKYSKSKRKGRNKNKKCQISTKQDSLGYSSSDSDSSDESDYLCKRHKNNNSHRKKDPIKLCTKLTAKLLTIAYKSKRIKFKLDEDPLQRRICFLTFVESLDMILYQYKETHEVLIYRQKIGG